MFLLDGVFKAQIGCQSKICIHYKLGVGLAYVQGEAYDGLEVLTPARVVDGGVL